MKKALPWVLAYAPQSVGDIVGQEEAIERIRKYLITYKPGQRPLLLVGRSGIGKTSAVYALAKEFDREVLEVNASDARNKDAIETIIGAASKQASLFFRGRIILVDEVDGVSGQKDRGGMTTLIGLFDGSAHPIICTAGQDDEERIKPLRKVCEVIEMNAPTGEHITIALSHIAKKEHISANNEDLLSIARRSGGDVRAAITDFQTLATNETVTKEDMQHLSDRDGRQAIEQALLRIFKTTSAEIALPSLDEVNMDVDELLLWMEENIPREYINPQDRARALTVLAEADKFFGRIRKWQYYRYYVYIYNLLTAGVALAKDAKYPGAGKYKRSERLLTLWIANQKNAKRKNLSQALISPLHASRRRIFRDLPILRIAYQKNSKTWQKAFVERYDIDDDGIAWLEK